MEFFVPRKLKFKAWNLETKLLMRLHSISCVQGELTKDHHILLQFTGLHDRQAEEIYDMDVLLIDTNRYVAHWSDDELTWVMTLLNSNTKENLNLQHHAGYTTRLCNYFELNR